MTRTPRPPHSAARVRVSPIRACLLALYAARSAMPNSPATELMLTMLPSPLRSISLPNSRLVRNGPVRFTSKTRRQSASVVSSAGVIWLIPALLTSTSTRPNSAIAASTIPRTAPSSETSPGRERVRAFLLRSSSSVPSGTERSLRATAYPRLANVREISRPMPRAAPVTTATRFSRSMLLSYWLTGFFGCSPHSTARRSSPAVAAILSRVSKEALPMCGARTTFSSSRSLGCTFGSSS